MKDLFPNPEIAWHAERSKTAFDPDEIVQRLGMVDEEVFCLSGGLANDTFRIGSDRVLRVYRRDIKALSRERQLLSRRWQQFRVPRVLDEGDDFLVLEYVEHGPLMNTAVHGFEVGRALAEIHQIRFDCCGLFGETVDVNEPWDDFPRVFEEFITSKVASSIVGHSDVFERCAEWIAKRRDILGQHCEISVLLHGDFKASNIHWGNDDRPLVLDWEFTYAGPPLMDIGQLVRWGIPQAFRRGFVKGYAQGGGRLPDLWEQRARCFDLVNLIGLLTKSAKGSQQATDCQRGIEETLATVAVD